MMVTWVDLDFIIWCPMRGFFEYQRNFRGQPGGSAWANSIKVKGFSW